ncbi:MAG: hypothetical protein VYE18_06800 [Pseudomonadota bacterium]|nr:hypothetical protein [Pseudomonadota bacterium]
MGRAIRAWDSDFRIGIAAPGSFSHFVIDEEMGLRLVKTIPEYDEDTLWAEPES